MILRKKTLAVLIGQAFAGVAIAISASGAYAQESVQRVEVTGTRIKSVGAVSSSPILSISAADIASAQPVAVEEFFKNLPSAVPAIGSGTNNGTGGAATIDLRGLGTQRSLVLIDGRRVVPFDLYGAVNTDTIPMALLKRVDLITGGASAVYGADAVAGVANFILEKNFKGFEASFSEGKTAESDGKRSRFDVTMGAGLDDGRGNIALSIGITRQDPVMQGARPWGSVSRSSTTGRPSGSFTTVPLYDDIVGGQIVPATGVFDTNNINTFNFNPLNYYQTGLDREQATALGHYQINKNVEAYTNVMFTKSTVKSTLAPSGSFFNDFYIPLGNPYIPAGARQQLCDAASLSAAQCADNAREVLLSPGRRFVEFGPRLNDFENTQYQFTLGFRGDIINNWTYDVYGSKGKADQVQTRGNWGSSSKVQQSLRALSTTTCIDTSNGCVPLNLFGADGSITPAMKNFVNLDAILMQKVEQKVFSGSVSGDLGEFKSAYAKSPISVSVGGEYRKMTALTKSDSATQINGEVLGTGAASPDSNGSFELKEFFGEAIIPLLENKEFARKLALETGFRRTNFEVAGASTDYNTWKFGADWEPVAGFRVRAMHQKAVRAPNISELFSPTVTGLNNLAVDPCAGNAVNQADANTPGTLSNLCLRTGVPLARLGSLTNPSAGQANVLTGGNANLGPEKAKTDTLGFVWQPSFVKSMFVTLDYYDIKIDEAVSTPAILEILDACYGNPAGGVSAACASVGRNPATGTFNGANAPGVALPYSNLGKIKTSGFDLGIEYSSLFRDLNLDSRWGSLAISWNTNIVDKYEFQSTPSSAVQDCLGYYSVTCGTLSGGAGPLFKQKWTQRTSWKVGDFVLGYNWRHVDDVKVQPSRTAYLPAYSSIDSFEYVDFSAVWHVHKMVRLNLSITNLFDKAPPEVGNTIGSTTANSGNTFPQYYDALGRFLTVGATVKF